MPVVLLGLHDTIDDLKRFDKDAAKKFNKIVNSTLDQAKVEAIGYVPETPMSGWQTKASTKAKKTTRGGQGWPAWNAETVRAGIKKSRAQGKVRGDYTTSAGALLNTDPAGAIFEIAGRIEGKETTARGKQFKANLERFSKASRVVWRAVDRNQAAFETRIYIALEEAKKDLQTALDKVKR
jgi:hypothetical protein